MTGMQLTGALLAIGLLVYLIVALIDAEKL